MKIAAILVLFDPSRDPRVAISSLIDVIDTVIIVDNCVDHHPALLEPLGSRVVLLRNNNVGGLAGAYNCAIDWIERCEKSVSHILFVDDDTDLDALRMFLASSATIVAANQSDVAAVAPIYRDRRTGLRGSHIQLERFFLRFLPREQSVPIDVTFVINSMSLWKREVVSRLGRHSTSLAVDHIDTEYAMRAKRAGYRIVLNASIEFLHEIGQRRTYRLLGRVLQAGGHSPRRRYLIGRNTMAVARTYGVAYPAFFVLCLQRLAYEAVGILVAEDRKSAKLVSLLAGSISGIFVRV